MYFTIKPGVKNRKLENYINKIQLELGKFFDYKIKKPPIFFIDSRKDMDIFFGEKTKDWLVGTVRNGAIYIFNPEVFERESSHQKIEFWKTLKHEYCHIYYNQITRSIYPVWLNEGLAGYISGKKLNYEGKPKNYFLDVISYFYNHESKVYLIGQFWVEHLINKFGSKKLIELIKTLEQPIDEKQFALKFYKVYKIRFNKSSLTKLIK